MTFLVAAFAVAALARYVVHTRDTPVKVTEIDHGAVNGFNIGDAKEVILRVAAGESFSPEPKPSECPANWISVRAMTEVQRTCLLGADIWHTEIRSTVAHCSGQTNEFDSLHFADNRLVKVVIRCVRAE